MLAVYQLTLVGTIVGILWMVTMLMNATTSLEESRDSLDSDDPLEYDSIERGVAERFNEFFFAATDGCSGMNTHCVSAYNISRCEICLVLGVCE